MYTNPSDYYMSLMKDAEASPRLVDTWKKAGGDWVTTPRLTAPEPQTPFTSGSKVAALNCSELLCTEAHHHQAAFLDSDWHVMGFTAAHAVQEAHLKLCR
jgi:hypothetical protein